MNTINSFKRAVATGFISAGFAMGAASVASAAPTVIGFEEFGNVGISGPTVTTDYPGVVFSSTGVNVNIVRETLNKS